MLDVYLMQWYNVIQIIIKYSNLWVRVILLGKIIRNHLLKFTNDTNNDSNHFLFPGIRSRFAMNCKTEVFYL